MRRSDQNHRSGKTLARKFQESMRIYIGNLSGDVSDAKLLELVTPFGKPDSAKVVTDRQTGQSRGFGFVELASTEEAHAAIAGLNGKQVGDQTLVVNEARPKR